MTILTIWILVACQNNPSNKSNESQSMNESTENFEIFMNQFYSDTIFQKSRIILPLDGVISEWNENDSAVKSDWKNREIYITDFETILKYKPNTKHTIVKESEKCIEKIFIENSGFSMERKFVLREKKWYLKEYNISNL